MQLSVEIQDHIFSFVSDHGTLFTCSKDPILSPIVERHLYHDVVVQIFGPGNPEYNFNTFEPDQLSSLISENPRILYHVRILQIRVEFVLYESVVQPVQAIRERLDKFASTLLMFPVLECIMLTSNKKFLWYWTDTFQAALEDRLNLPVLTELHLLGCRHFPSSLLDKCKNIKNLSLTSGESFEIAEGRVPSPTLPQLKSLTLCSQPISFSLRSWLKRHVSELQTLKFLTSTVEVLSELLGACAGTLNNLELYLSGYRYSSKYIFRTGEIQIKHFPELPLIPNNLQQLIIYANAYMGDDEPTTCCMSSLPAAAEAINLFIPSLRHLVLDIDVGVSSFSDLTNIEFSPLAVLGAASLSVPRIDLYVHTGIAPAALTRAQLMSSLGEDEDIRRSVEEGRLVIHSEKIAPGRV